VKKFQSFFENNSNIKDYEIPDTDVNTEDIKITLNNKVNIDLYNYNDISDQSDMYMDDLYTMESDIIEKNSMKFNLSNLSNKVGFASEDDIDPNIRLKCKDSIKEKQTCTDFCNDQRYFLRRLQIYDNPLFHPPIVKGEKYKKYSSKCQSSDNRQPVVLAYNPELEPIQLNIVLTQQ
jgi:hypothetical protein